MVECGWKYNMDNIQAALLLPQLEKIDKTWEKRLSLYNRYCEEISNIDDIEIPLLKTDVKSGLHLFTIWVKSEKRDLVLNALGKAEIGAAVNYRAIHLLSWFKNNFGYRKGDFPIAERIGSRTVSLPFWPGMPDMHIENVISILKQQ